ncbi:alpha/beta hydrolase [Pelagerythrobacter marinus]|nr:alpha/beta hydrolase [Pelagerythrobacter marinus]
MRWLKRIAIALALLALATFLAFRFSPWPSVAVIAYAFSDGERVSEAALARHVPPGIETRRDLAYGPGRDERFDINRRAQSPGPQPAIVWVHGGAWIAGSKDGIANYMKVLAGRGFTTVAVEYSTGRGSRYPRPVEQVNRALGHIVANAGALGIDPDGIVLAGDSAGAQIAAQVALLTTDDRYARALGIAPQVDRGAIRALLLLSGAYDLGSVDLEGDYGWFVRSVLWAYSGSRDFLEDERFALASVTDHVGPAFPPSFVSSGNGDPLEPQARRLAQRLRGEGVAVETLFFAAGRRPELPHEYQFNLDDPAGAEALERMAAFAHRHAGSPPRASRN